MDATQTNAKREAATVVRAGAKLTTLKAEPLARRFARL
jgi:hypothetical protein